MIRIKIKKLRDDVILPQKYTGGATCFDLRCVEDIVLETGRITIVKTGIAVEIPRGWEMLIRPRSGLATKGVTIVNSPGTIDSDYRGEIMVIMTTLNKRHTGVFDPYYTDGGGPFQIKAGSRIAQASIAPVEFVSWHEVNELSKTERGFKGLGSTGL